MNEFHAAVCGLVGTPATDVATTSATVVVEALQAGNASGVWQSGSAGRWTLRHGSEIKTAFWVVGLIASLVLVGLGVSSCQAEFGNYRLKLEQKNPPVIMKPWGYELKDGG